MSANGNQWRSQKRSYQLPSHWPRVEVPYVEDNPNRAVCPEHGLRVIIGYDIHETAVMEPARFYIKFVKVPKYKCHGHPECGIQQQPAPDGLVKGNKIDTSIGAQGGDSYNDLRDGAPAQSRCVCIR
ncbi:MAG: hypothetical protein ACK506_17855 [Pirellula sp.]